MHPELPRVLTDFEPLPGTIKADCADFVVEELPLYPADGTGTHTFFLLEKTGIPTSHAVGEIARALHLRRHAIGVAGLKDARAVTRQWMSVEHVPPEVVAALKLPRLRVLQVTRHHNKLRLGHHRGNAFTIRVRNTDAARLADVQAGLDLLARYGVPNSFAEQRFGNRGDTWAIGRALLAGDADEAVDLILGRPGDGDLGRIRRARELYEQGDYSAAARAWPGPFRSERRMLHALARPPVTKRRALGAVERSTRLFYVSAYQSYLFNRVLAARLESAPAAPAGEVGAVRPGLAQLWMGDLAWIHASGAVFRVEDPALEQPRADRFEISATGPLFGHRMTSASGAAGELEAAVLEQEHLPEGALVLGPFRPTGGRRALRFRPEQTEARLGADARGPYLELRFVLPRGAYATALLRELFSLTPARRALAGAEVLETEPWPRRDGTSASSATAGRRHGRGRPTLQ